MTAVILRATYDPAPQYNAEQLARRLDLYGRRWRKDKLDNVPDAAYDVIVTRTKERSK